MSGDEVTTYVLPASEPQGVLMGRSLPQLAAGLSTGLVGLMIASSGAVVAGLVVMGLAVGLAYGSVGGESVISWIAMWATVGWRKACGRSEWFAPLVSGTTDADGELVELEPCLPPFLVDHRIECLPVSVTGGGEVGIVREPSSGLVTVMLRVSGRQFAMAEPSEQERLVSSWGSTLALFSARRGVRQISWTAVGTPEGMDTHREWLAGQAGGSETARAVYADLLGAVDEKGLLRHEVVVSVTVDRRKLRVRRRPGGLTVAEQVAGEAVAAAREIGAQLSGSGHSVGGLLSGPDIAGWLRARIDPVRQAAVAAEQAKAVDGPWELSVTEAGPVHVGETVRHVELDGRFHCVLRVTHWPRVPVRAGWLEPMLRWNDGHRVLTVGFEPVNPAKSARDLKARMNHMEADEDVRRSQGRRTTMGNKAAAAEAKRLEAELHRGFVETRWFGVVAISADSVDELWDAVDAYTAFAANSHIELRPMTGRMAAGWALAAGIGVLPGPSL